MEDNANNNAVAEVSENLNNQEPSQNINDDSNTNSTYRVSLDFFEGPLDLLLAIIKEKKMDIETVRLGDLTDQYLQYIAGIEELDMDNTSEFIEMAAQLIEIKSRTLLPVEVEEGADENDIELDLRARLKEKKLFEEASLKLMENEDLNKLYKQPDKMANNVKIILKDMVLDNMLDAFAMMMAQVPKRIIAEQEPKQISKDRFTVKDRILTIKTIIKEKQIMKFTELFDDQLTKGELINTFLALLELLKHQFVKAEQGEIFGEIDILCNNDKIDEDIQEEIQYEQDERDN